MCGDGLYIQKWGKLMIDLRCVCVCVCVFYVYIIFVSTCIFYVLTQVAALFSKLQHVRAADGINSLF